LLDLEPFSLLSAPFTAFSLYSTHQSSAVQMPAPP
jgi:hypothetical protein